jgi:hypothetical protein
LLSSSFWAGVSFRADFCGAAPLGLLVAPGVVAPGVVPVGDVAPGVLVPGVVVPGVVVPGVVVPGVLVAGALAPGIVVVGATGTLAAGAVVIVVVAVLAEPDPSASLTNAAASTPSASAATTASDAIGAFQLGVAARRVRAAAPQAMHQSWSGCRAVPQSGHASLTLARGGTAAPDELAAPAPASGGPPTAADQPVAEGLVGPAETVTSRPPAGG